ncbi:MAG: hypothetical protein QOF69_242 [Solirubrobacteraceae bacterium]|jgi:hypothetical protein|nr:hypothetical protein [Solirubrobacteraceae bacterium]
MTHARRFVSTLLVGGACITGLAACGDSAQKVSDQSFIDECTKTVGTDATAKAYAADICKCAQDNLKAKGLGDKTADDKATVAAANTEIATCTREKVLGQ